MCFVEGVMKQEYLKQDATGLAQMVARKEGIMRSWKKAGNRKAFSHLERWHRAELEVEKKRISTLRHQMVALSCSADAKDAKITAQAARIVRLMRKLRVRSGR